MYQELDISQISEICAGIKQIIHSFIIDEIQEKLKTKYFKKFKNSIFGQFFGQDFHFQKI